MEVRQNLETRPKGINGRKLELKIEKLKIIGYRIKPFKSSVREKGRRS